MEQYEIIRKKASPFQGDGGETIDYFWYKAKRLSDGVTIEIGSRNASYEEGQTYELRVEKTERPGGRFGYKDIT